MFRESFFVFVLCRLCRLFAKGVSVCVCVRVTYRGRRIFGAGGLFLIVVCCVCSSASGRFCLRTAGARLSRCLLLASLTIQATHSTLLHSALHLLPPRARPPLHTASCPRLLEEGKLGRMEAARMMLEVSVGLCSLRPASQPRRRLDCWA